jgi:hypothetical protein
MLRPGSTESVRKLVDPPYLGKTSLDCIQTIIESDEHRALGEILSDVSNFEKVLKCEKAVLEIGMEPEQESRLKSELKSTSNLAQSDEIKNIGMMALLHFFRSQSKGTGGLVGGKNSKLLDFSKLHANHNARGVGSDYETVIFMHLEFVDKSEADITSALKRKDPIPKNLIVATARIENGAIVDAHFSFSGMFIARPISNTQMVISPH